MKKYLLGFLYYFVIPVILLTTIFVTVFFGRALYLNYFSRVKEVSVPNIVGENVLEAEKILISCGLKLQVGDHIYSKSQPKNTVLRQTPPSGRKIKPGRTIFLTISLGNETPTVPNLIGKDLQQSKVLLENAGFKLGNLISGNDKTKPWGEILGQNPYAGANAPMYSLVELTVNEAGKSKVKVPDLKQRTMAQGLAELARNRLKVGEISWNWDDSIPRGEIYNQQPKPGKDCQPDSEVDISVSAGFKGDKIALKQKRLKIYIPQGDGYQKTQIFVTDQLGEYEFYKGNHQTGEDLEILVTAWGDGEATVIINNQVQKREKI